MSVAPLERRERRRLRSPRTATVVVPVSVAPLERRERRRLRSPKTATVVVL
ncbi:MAG: hypothetical protein M3N32_06710 [Actinomycetota bacterium]|nr:hypothetical protein [Actinomycetota bacterium]